MIGMIGMIGMGVGMGSSLEVDGSGTGVMILRECQIPMTTKLSLQTLVFDSLDCVTRIFNLVDQIERGYGVDYY